MESRGGVADVAGEQGASFSDDRAGDSKGRAVDILRLKPDEPELRPVGIVGRGLDHVRAGLNEVAVELLDQIGRSRTTSGTDAPAWRYPRRSNSKRLPSARMAGPAARRSRRPGQAFRAGFVLADAMT